jgi:dihydropteroate synthase
MLTRPLAWGTRTFVMGILNITLDSFSGDGVLDVTTAVSQAITYHQQGADILDIGGESTRPNGEPISAEQEQARVLPIITAVRQALPHALISIDTYRASTAQLALQAGANWVNDIWGFQHDPDLPAVVAAAGCPVVLMHNGRNRPRHMGNDSYYGDFVYHDLLGEIKAELQASVNIALNAGVRRENIILDPGIGFGKNGAQNLELLRRLRELKTLGYPLLLGTSRKGFIGQVLGGLPPEERVEGTAVTVTLGIAQGVDIIRVHDVLPMTRTARMADALCR